MDFLQSIIGYLEKHGEVANYRAQMLTGLSAESVKKYLAQLVEAGILRAIGEKKGRRYVLPKSS